MYLKNDQLWCTDDLSFIETLKYQDSGDSILNKNKEKTYKLKW